MKRLPKPFLGFLGLFLSPLLVAVDRGGEFSGELSFEARSYLERGAYGNTGLGDFSIILQPEYAVAWEEDRKVVSFEPFIRLSSLDDERTHGDIRELSFVGSWDLFELRIGISKVFWGVTESQHLVDVINQTDLVESPDGEDKLGQPMVNFVYVNEYGNFEFFILPYFRERTFSGYDGRFRTNLVVDGESPIYLHGDEESHIDGAIRWSHYLGGLDWAISYFEGTDREPTLKANLIGTKLVPVYGQSKQASLELQYVVGDWLLKSEVLSKDSDQNGNYWAMVAGFEYTFANYYQGMDVGVLYEYLYDDRGESSGSGLDDASFVGSRIALNDEKSLEFLVGGIVEHETGKLSNAFLESSRRINENWKWTIEGSFFAKPKSGSFLEKIKRDDYLQGSLSYFW
jgi:hypothetical protein|tara:strand:- start:482 stop:1681 length:1200 start_codon:yes stop_codon:yes gene_type:complete